MKPGDTVRLKTLITAIDECDCCGHSDEYELPAGDFAKLIFIDEETQAFDFETMRYRPNGSRRIITFTLDTDELDKVEVV